MDRFPTFFAQKLSHNFVLTARLFFFDSWIVDEMIHFEKLFFQHEIN